MIPEITCSILNGWFYFLVFYLSFFCQWYWIVISTIYRSSDIALKRMISFLYWHIAHLRHKLIPQMVWLFWGEVCFYFSNQLSCKFCCVTDSKWVQKPLQDNGIMTTTVTGRFCTCPPLGDGAKVPSLLAKCDISHFLHWQDVILSSCSFCQCLTSHYHSQQCFCSHRSLVRLSLC